MNAEEMPSDEPDVTVSVDETWKPWQGKVASGWSRGDGVLRIDSPEFLRRVRPEADLVELGRQIAGRFGVTIGRAHAGETAYGRYVLVEGIQDEMLDVCTWILVHPTHDPLIVRWASPEADENGQAARAAVLSLRPGEFSGAVATAVNVACSAARDGKDFVNDHATLFAFGERTVVTVDLTPFFDTPDEVVASVCRHERARIGADVVTRTRTVGVAREGRFDGRAFSVYAESSTRRRRFLVLTPEATTRADDLRLEPVTDFFLPPDPRIAAGLDAARLPDH
jgi:hypothetical protein